MRVDRSALRAEAGRAVWRLRCRDRGRPISDFRDRLGHRLCRTRDPDTVRRHSPVAWAAGPDRACPGYPGFVVAGRIGPASTVASARASISDFRRQLRWSLESGIASATVELGRLISRPPVSSRIGDRCLSCRSARRGRCHGPAARLLQQLTAPITSAIGSTGAACARLAPSGAKIQALAPLLAGSTAICECSRSTVVVSRRASRGVGIVQRGVGRRRGALSTSTVSSTRQQISSSTSSCR